MNDSIKEFIEENADEQNDADEDNNDSLKKSLEKPTLYWAVLEDGDFIPGENLQLNEIGKTQVYVGKSIHGIKRRWIKDGGSHCANMKKCLDNACAMITTYYDPPKMKGITLVDARLTLAKVRGEKTALFLIKSFGDNVEKSKIPKQKVETGNEEAKSNNQEAEQEYEEAAQEYEEAEQEYEEAEQEYEEAEQVYKQAKKKYEEVLSKYGQTPSDGKQRKVTKRKETMDNAEETSKKAPINLEEKQETIKKEKKCVKKTLCDAEKNHRNGKRVEDENLNIITLTVEMTWVPKNMGYGMNYC